MNRWVQYVLPFGLVRALQFYQQLVDLGVSPGRAVRLAIDRTNTARLSRTNLDLLPPGTLAGIGAIVDVGANNGDWAADVQRFCSSNNFICVEPEPTLASQLRSRFGARVTVVEAAMGEVRGMTAFKIMHRSVLNSILSPTPAMAALFPQEFVVKGAIEVMVKPLDEVTSELKTISLLKIDVQGYEQQVLAGAAQTLRKTDLVLLEVNFQRHYTGEATFFELDALMNSHGFCIGNYSHPLGGRRQALLADVLYVRRDS